MLYDTDGRRIQKIGPEGTTHYYLNGSAVIAQRTDEGERMDFLYDDIKEMSLHWNMKEACIFTD